jgi:hypothetical protein
MTSLALALLLSQFPPQTGGPTINGADGLGNPHPAFINSFGALSNSPYSPPLFSSVATFVTSTPSAAEFSSAADFNSDGFPDLAVTVVALNQVWIYFGNANGNLGAPTKYTVGSSPRWTTINDFNLDGCPDWAVTNRADGTVSIFLNALSGSTCTGTFTQSALLTGLTLNRSIGSGVIGNTSVTGNGVYPGIVITSASGTNGQIYYGNGAGQFDAGQTFTGANSAFQLIYTDINTDGNPDIVTLGEADSTIQVNWGMADGGFTTSTTLATTPDSVPSGIAVKDVNGDNIPDIAVTAQKGVDVYLGNNNNFLANRYAVGPVTQYFYSLGVGEDGQGLAIGDLNGDGYPDIVAALQNNNTTGGIGDQLVFYAGNGTGVFVQSQLIPFPGLSLSTTFSVTVYPIVDMFPSSSHPSTLLDFNRDGRADIVAHNAQGTLTVPSLFVFYSAPISLTAPALGTTTYVTPSPGTNFSGSRGPEAQSVVDCNSKYATYMGTLANRTSVAIQPQFDGTPIWVGGPQVTTCPGCPFSISDAGFTDGGPGVVGEQISAGGYLSKNLGTGPLSSNGPQQGLYCIKASGAQDSTYDGGWTVITELP